jgi:hypothetical protein
MPAKIGVPRRHSNERSIHEEPVSLARGHHDHVRRLGEDRDRVGLVVEPFVDGPAHRLHRREVTLRRRPRRPEPILDRL